LINLTGIQSADKRSADLPAGKAGAATVTGVFQEVTDVFDTGALALPWFFYPPLPRRMLLKNFQVG